MDNTDMADHLEIYIFFLSFMFYDYVSKIYTE